MSKDAFETQRQDFLWYVYFGITKTDAENYKEKALEACIDRAYQDLPRTLKYKYSINYLQSNPENKPEEEFKELKDNFEALKENYKSYVAKMIFDSIKRLLNGELDFNNWHSSLCNVIIDISNDTNEDEAMNKKAYGPNLFKQEKGEKRIKFYYGQAQKWVNMTLKYMIIMGLLNFDEYKECLHVPIDRYIFREILDGKETYKGKAWSRIDYDDYIEIQKKIDSKKSSQSAIEWESEVWLKQAKEENNK